MRSFATNACRVQCLRPLIDAHEPEARRALQPAIQFGSARAAARRSSRKRCLSNADGALVSHSQTTSTLQPSSRSSPETRASRSTLATNLRCQNSLFDAGVVVKRQPGCRWKKQPWTKSTRPSLGNTRSGVPGRSRRCRRKRNPRRCAIRLTTSSGLVFVPRTARIMRLRVAALTVSIRCGLHRERVRRYTAVRLAMIAETQSRAAESKVRAGPPSGRTSIRIGAGPS